MSIRRMVVAGMAVVTAGFGVASAQADTDSSAVTCRGWSTRMDINEADQVKYDRKGYIRTGPYGECDPVRVLAPGTELDTVCYVQNDYGNTWSRVHVRDGSTGLNYWGWIYDVSLIGNGSGRRC